MSIVKHNPRVSSGYTDFLASLDLFSVALVRSTFRVNREEYLKDEDTNVNFRLSSKGLDVSESHFDVCSTLRLKISSVKTKKLQLWLTAVFELHFHGSSPLDPKFVKQFCESEIRLVVWPYFREYVSNITSRMHIPPFVLPLSEDGKTK